MKIIVDYENGRAPVVYNDVVMHGIWTREDIVSIVDSDYTIEDKEIKKKFVDEIINYIHDYEKFLSADEILEHAADIWEDFNG